MSTSQPPRLRIVHTEASEGWGGQEIRILTEMQGMAARGHQVTLLCTAESQIYPAAKDRGLPVVAMPLAKLSLGNLAALWRWLRANPCDVINTHSSNDSWLVALARLALWPAPPMVRTRHISKDVSNNLGTRWLYHKATTFTVTTGEALRDQLIRDNGMNPACVRSVITGIDLDHFRPGDRAEACRQAGLDPTLRYITSVATLRSWKGHSFLMDAFAGLTAPDLRLLIVGDGPQEPNLRKHVKTLGIEDRVIFAGRQKNVVPYLQASTVFAQASYAYEGVPQAIMQAMACALPVVSTTLGAIGEAVIAGETGLLVPPKDVPALRQALQQLLDHPEQARAMAQAGRARAEKAFIFDRLLDAMEEVFRGVLA